MIRTIGKIDPCSGHVKLRSISSSKSSSKEENVFKVDSPLCTSVPNKPIVLFIYLFIYLCSVFIRVSICTVYIVYVIV